MSKILLERIGWRVQLGKARWKRAHAQDNKMGVQSS